MFQEPNMPDMPISQVLGTFASKGLWKQSKQSVGFVCKQGMQQHTVFDR